MNRHDRHRGPLRMRPEVGELARRRLREEAESQARQADIATCECGGQARHNGREWVHVGPCGITREGEQ